MPTPSKSLEMSRGTRAPRMAPSEPPESVSSAESCDPCPSMPSTCQVRATSTAAHRHSTCSTCMPLSGAQNAYSRTLSPNQLPARPPVESAHLLRGIAGRDGGDAWCESQSSIAGRSRTMGAHPLVSQRYIYREHHPTPCAREVEVDFDFHAWRAFRRARATRATLETFKIGCLHPAWPCSSLSNVCRE